MRSSTTLSSPLRHDETLHHARFGRSRGVHSQLDFRWFLPENTSRFTKALRNDNNAYPCTLANTLFSCVKPGRFDGEAIVFSKRLYKFPGDLTLILVDDRDFHSRLTGSGKAAHHQTKKEPHQDWKPDDKESAHAVSREYLEILDRHFENLLHD